MAIPSGTSPCDHIRRIPPVLTVDEDLREELTTNFRVLPLYEKTLYEHNLRKYYSLGRNNLLNCRWKEFKDNWFLRVVAPHKTIDPRDFHFFNSDARLMPSLSMRARTDFRIKLDLGPGVDSLGQKPIPQDILMKRIGGCKYQDLKNQSKRSSSTERRGTKEFGDVKSSQQLLSGKKESKEVDVDK